jgi:NADPH-dependent 2,4-dienoyl-CoA reductase/sulfur reductase-like enzyme
MARLLIVGGSDAGISAGLRARQVDPQLQVTLLLADRFPNYSICGLPFYISGETPDWRALAHRRLDDLQGAGLNLLTETVADSCDANARLLRAHSPQSGEQQFQYDWLIIATGADAQVAKRIDIFAAALYCDLRVDKLLDLDLSYTPPFAAPWDAVQVAAQEWLLS